MFCCLGKMARGSIRGISMRQKYRCSDPCWMPKTSIVRSYVCLPYKLVRDGSYNLKHNPPEISFHHAYTSTRNAPGFPYFNTGKSTLTSDAAGDEIRVTPLVSTSTMGELDVLWTTIGVGLRLALMAVATPPPTTAPTAKNAARTRLVDIVASRDGRG